MSEIKHTFQAGRMNKDLDERLVPQGEYRDALNIEVRTSDGGDVGTVQNISGNIQINSTLPTVGWNGEKSRLVGSIANNREDEAYFFIASPPIETTSVASVVTTKLHKDMIVRYNTNVDWSGDALTPVVTDVFKVEVPGSDMLFLDASNNEITSNTHTSDTTSYTDSVLAEDWVCNADTTITITKPGNWYSAGTTRWPENGSISVTNGAVTETVSYLGFPFVAGSTGVSNANIVLTVVPSVSTNSFVASNAVTAPTNTTSSYSYVEVPKTVGEHIRPGMVGSIRQHDLVLGIEKPLVGFTQNEDPTISSFTVARVTDASGFAEPAVQADNMRVYFTKPMHGLIVSNSIYISTAWVFEAPRVLNFTQEDNPTITGINIIDNLLFWTDNRSEPKKINIDRCVAGTSSFDSHTDLMIYDPESPSNLVKLEAVDNASNSHLKEEHISVIRRAPRTSPRLEMSSFEGGNSVPVGGVITNKDFTPDVVGDGFLNYIEGLGDYMYPPGTSLLLTNSDVVSIGEVAVAVHVGNVNMSFLYEELDNVNCLENSELGNNPTGYTFYGAPCGQSYYPNLIIDSLDENILNSMTSWDVSIVQKKPIFELNMGRFSYRYRYQDGEYSSFAPWSELAFSPGKFDYTPKKGYNLGMVNTIRDLKITDFIVEDRTRPDDIVEVDVLYKDTVSPNVLVVKTIKRGLDPEWDEQGVGGNYGVINVASEMMNQILPSLQSLRAWDNVPLKAKAQEVTGNRLVYGNYLQNFDLPVVSVIQNTSSTEHLGDLMPVKSLKSIRKYKIGVVFGDKYGRETPVTGIGGITTSDGLVNNSSVTIEKEGASKINKLQASLNFNDETPSDWMEYYKYYVKETTNEYYNLLQYKWYNAEDGNIWLSFPSADRNKVDEQTYLILKNEHGNDNAVADEARYKVLDIKNEAPDFVRTTSKIVADATLTDLNIFTSLHESLLIDIDDDEFDTSLQDLKFKGVGWVRVKGIVAATAKYSKWVRVARINTVDKTIITTIPLGTTALLHQTFGTTDTTDITWSCEVKDDQIENRPEFDGKFFVKVNRDSIISNKIMQVDPSLTVFETLSSVGFRSISTSADINPANENATYQGDYSNDLTDISTSLPPITGTNNRTGDAWNASGNVEGFDAIVDTAWVQYWLDFGISDSDLLSTMLNQNSGGAIDYSSSLMAYDCNFSNTNEYWEYIAEEIQDGSPWFLDNAHHRDKNGFATTPAPTTAMEVLTHGGRVNSGKGLYIEDEGGYTGLSAMDFGATQPGSTATMDVSLYQGFQESGLFRFTGDPFGVVYTVEHITNISSVTNWASSGGGMFTPLCADCNEETSSNCKRLRFTVYFKKAIGGGTLDTDTWDPRSTLRADGTQLSSIEFLSVPSINAGITTEFTDNNAVWETEPKENIELDLYYEASDALPIKLKDENIESFCPKQSKITVHRPSSGTDGSLSLVDMNVTNFQESSYVWSKMKNETMEGGIGVTTVGNQLLVSSTAKDIVATFEDDGEILKPYQVAINDTLKFTHSNDTITSARVIDHMKLVDSTSKIYESSPTFNIPVKFTRGNSLGTTMDEFLMSTNSSNPLPSTGNEVIGKLWQLTHIRRHTDPLDQTSAQIEIYPNGVPQCFLTMSAQQYAEAEFITPQTNIALVHNLLEVGAIDTGLLDSSAPNGYLRAALFAADSTADNHLHHFNLTIKEVTGYYKLDNRTWKSETTLPWFNCYSFGNGLESDRIRDDYNAPQIDNGVKASTSVSVYGEERRGSGMIHSGIYNSTSGINNLNEFNMAESITKDLNPSYGSIQILKTRDTNVLAFCEDKVLEVLANKDALYNADGSANLIASSKVLGATKSFAGEYGISSNPESLAVDGYRMYFTDKQRNKVLRLSQDGLTPISDIGMKSWFRDNFTSSEYNVTVGELIGSFDTVKGDYNLTLRNTSKTTGLLLGDDSKDTTVSFNEKTKGWSSFKSFIPEVGLSINTEYITGKLGELYTHQPGAFMGSTIVNTFYGSFTNSTIDVLFNDNPGAVKSFMAINYEGSQAKVSEFATTTKDSVPYSDGEYYNLQAKDGWYVDSFNTDLQDAKVLDFKNKEGKWFNNISGIEGTLSNLDTSEFSVQGIGVVASVQNTELPKVRLTIKENAD